MAFTISSPSSSTSQPLSPYAMPSPAPTCTHSETAIASADILHQFWAPCTGESMIGQYMDYLQFPVSYRPLYDRWKQLGQPKLRSLRTPLSIQYNCRSRQSSASSSSSSLTLQEIAEAQESAIIRSIQSRLQGESAEGECKKLFVSFASHLDIYAAVHAELTAIEMQYVSAERQLELYESSLQSLLEEFDVDRSVCMARESHCCLGQLCWGEMYKWPLDEIKRRFEAFRRRSSTFSSSPSTPYSMSRSSSTLVLSSYGIGAGENQSAALLTPSSSFDFTPYHTSAPVTPSDCSQAFDNGNPAYEKTWTDTMTLLQSIQSSSMAQQPTYESFTRSPSYDSIDPHHVVEQSSLFEDFDMSAFPRPPSHDSFNKIAPATHL